MWEGIKSITKTDDADKYVTLPKNFMIKLQYLKQKNNTHCQSDMPSLRGVSIILAIAM